MSSPRLPRSIRKKNRDLRRAQQHKAYKAQEPVFLKQLKHNLDVLLTNQASTETVSTTLPEILANQVMFATQPSQYARRYLTDSVSSGFAQASSSQQRVPGTKPSQHMRDHMVSWCRWF